MTFLIAILEVLLVLTILLVIYLKLTNRRIEKAPLKYAMDTYLAEPDGEEGYIEREDGSRIRYLVAGSGQPIVLAHGYGGSLAAWQVLSADLVQKGYRVITFDQRGHEKSTIGSDGIGSQEMASDYKAVLEHFDVKDGVILGHSMGGFLLQVFLLNHPEVVKERLKGAILMATFAGDINRDNAQNKVQIPLIKSGILVALTKMDLFGIPFVNTLTGDHCDMGMVKGMLQVFNRINHKALIPILQAFVEENHYDRLGEIDLPVRVIVGEKDKTTPPFHSDNMASGIQGASLTRIPDKGHLLNWEAPEVLADALVALAKGETIASA
ncbi:MAG: alpha/beta hydrolase [Bacteroidota bacterium]